MNLLHEQLCDGKECSRKTEKQTVAHILIHSTHHTNLCRACLTVALGSFNKVEINKENVK